MTFMYPQVMSRSIQYVNLIILPHLNPSCMLIFEIQIKFTQILGCMF